MSKPGRRAGTHTHTCTHTHTEHTQQLAPSGHSTGTDAHTYTHLVSLHPCRSGWLTRSKEQALMCPSQEEALAGQRLLEASWTSQFPTPDSCHRLWVTRTDVRAHGPSSHQKTQEHKPSFTGATYTPAALLRWWGKKSIINKHRHPLSKQVS